MTDLKLARDFTLPLDVVTEAIGIVATRGAGKSYASAVLLEEAHAAGVPFVVLDPSGVYHGLRSSANGEKAGLPVYVLGGPHGDVPLEDSAGKFTADLVVDSGHSFVLDLSDFTKTKMRKFVAEFLERLYDRKARSRTTLLLVVDEADEFAPQKPRGDTINSLAAMETIAKRGRARGLGIVMITQRTQALNKDVLDLIETLVAMRQLAERSRESVKGWIADKELRDDAGIIESLQALPTGTAWVWSPLRGILEKVAIRRIRTFDSYETPKPGQAKAEPKRRAELDLDALGEQMRATVERAKANDPAELRRRVRDLEKKLAAQPAATETKVETVVERVEVPVLDGNLDTLIGAVGSMQELAGQLVGFGEQIVAAGDLVLTGAREISTALERVGGRAETAERRSASAQPGRAKSERTVPPRRPSPPAPRSTAAAEGDIEITASQQRVLDALAWFEAVGIMEPARPAIAFIAGSRPTSGGFKNNLGALRTAGLLDYPQPNHVALTDAGRDAAQPPTFAPSNDELQEAVLSRVTGSQASILRTLIAVYPDPLDRDQLADTLGVPTTSGGFKNNLGALRTLELLDYPSPGWVVALPVLFPEGA